MKYRPEQEQRLLENILATKYCCEEYCESQFPWGEPGPLQQFRIRTWQRDIMRDIDGHMAAQIRKYGEIDSTDAFSVFQEVVVSGRGIGKSALFGMLNSWHLSSHVGASTLITANTETQLKTKTFPEQAKWFTLAMNSHWWEVGSLYIRPQPWLATTVKDQMKIDPKYWGAEGQNWLEDQPDAFAGTHNMYGLAVFFDESSGIPEPIWKVTKGFFTEKNPFRFWIGFSNGRRNKGAFFNRFHDPKLAKYWRGRHIDARTVEDVDKAVYEEIIEEYGADSDTARIEVYGQFPRSGEGQLIPTTDVDAARVRDIPPFLDENEPLILGVDPAPRSGRTVMRFRRGRDARSIAPTVLFGKDNNVIAGEVARLCQKYDPDAVAIDAGMGTGVIDILRKQYHINVHEVWFVGKPDDSNAEFAYLGGQLWGKMRDWIEREGCIDDSAELRRDLCGRTWEFQGGRDSGKKVLNDKRQMQKDGIPSPDDGDALALTFYPNIPRRDLRTSKRPGQMAVRKVHGTQKWDFA